MKISIKQVAEDLKIDPMTVRIMLQLGKLPFGLAYKKPKNQNWSYIIWPAKYYEYIGGNDGNRVGNGLSVDS